MRLLRDLYQLAGPMYGAHQNIYGVRDGGKIVLVDTGMGDSDYNIVRRVMGDWGLFECEISQVLLTHAHYEHSANAYRYRKNGAHVVIHEAEANGLETGGDETAAFAFVNEGPFTPCKADVPVTDGAVIQTGNLRFEVIHTPGHSGGSVLYRLVLEGKTILFTGDTVLTGKLCQRAALGWTGGADFSWGQYTESLKQISTMKTDILLPGHGELCMWHADRLLVSAYQQARLLLAAGADRGLKTEPKNRV
ncbi:hydrolase [Spirochaetia bacterium]|nr:hydrolase [Spirochaetia bacterium]